MVTAPEAAPHIERFLDLELSSKLSAPALETLAIVAYQQPVTRAEMEAVRGVNCDSVLRTLLSKGLIEEVGRLPQAGRPIVYGTTFEFLQHFGLQDLAELPPLENLENKE
jgi:segregation and condensation protein B